MDLLEKIKEDQVKFIELQFTDIFGTLKAVTVNAAKLEDILKEGKWFDGSSIHGFARIYESDMLLKPDRESYILLPFEKDENKITARLFCDVYLPNNQPFDGHPREVLKRTLNEARQYGYSFNVSPELEFFFFKTENGLQPLPHDKSGYLDAGIKDMANTIKKEIMSMMNQVGIEAEMSHHEVSPGQHEIGFRYGEALKIADNTLLFKQIVKSLAQQHSLYATFMPKPIFGINGSGMHTHFSLFNTEGKNLFYDKNDSHQLSLTAKQFIAGLLKYIKEITILLNPTVNSYKRLTPGHEAPVYICWAGINRSALIRVPAFVDEKNARAEIRSPDPSCSPHLAFAALLKAGLQGIKEELKYPEPIEENVYLYDEKKLKEKGIETLPDSLKHAIRKAEESIILKELLGESLFSQYLAAKNKEWEEFRTQVTDWEIKRYLEQI